MAAISYRLFDEGSKPYLTLAGDEYVRPLGIGNDWTNVKVVMLCAVTPNGTSNITNTTVQFGLCSGTQQTIASGYCKSAVFYSGVNRTLAWTAGPYFATTPAPYMATYVDNTYTESVGSVTMSFGLTGKRFVAAMGVTKGSPNYRAYYSYTNTTYFGVDFSPRHLAEALDVLASDTTGAWVLDGVTAGAYTNFTNVPFDESAGVLDTLNIYWSKTAFPLEIYGLYVVRAS